MIGQLHRQIPKCGIIYVPATRTGILIILSSPSGAGKSTLANRLMAWDNSIRFSVSATTRPARDGEVDGQHYAFRTRAEFGALVARGEMLEHAEVFGNLYGTPRAPAVAAVEAGCDILFDVDWQGGQQIGESDLKNHVVSVFILPPSIAALHERIKTRGTDSAEVVATRMARARDEISQFKGYDYVLINNDLDTCAARLKTIVAAERLRRVRQMSLADTVRTLNAEFEDIRDAF
ncbi:MAG: guanylate kinase [Rhodobacteraceae bacterium]|nr:guanylate kinase [Paracoccaceae bacterium]